MTIESVSYPDDLSSWDGSSDRQPFYLELFGETSPVLDIAYAEVCAPPASQVDDTSRASPLYEHWWTIGRPGPFEHHGGLLGKLPRPEDLWERLHDPAARVYLYFPLGGGWRVKELAATIKYMRPVPHEKEFLERAAQDWGIIGPFVEGASSLAMNAGPVGAAAGLAAHKTVATLNSLAHLKIGTVPQIAGFEWTATKVTARSDTHGGALQGVVWSLPRSLLTELGGRITGSLAVSFIPDRKQRAHEVWDKGLTFESKAILAQAVVYGSENEEHWAPAQDSRADDTPEEDKRAEDKGVIELAVSPRFQLEPVTSP